jgi:hypothetical protein
LGWTTKAEDFQLSALRETEYRGYYGRLMEHKKTLKAIKWRPSKEAIEAALAVDTGIGQGASYDHGRYMYINAVLEAAYKVEFDFSRINKLLKRELNNGR